MPSRLRQVLPHCVMLVASLLLYGAATRIAFDTGGRIGPAVWPKTIIVIMGLLCAYEIVRRLAGRSSFSATGLIGGLDHNPQDQPVIPDARQGGPELVIPDAREGSDGGSTSEHPRKLAGGIALVAAYVIAAPWLGFFLATALFLAIFPSVGGLRRPILTAAIGVIGSVALIVVFMRVAYISLPLGEGPFRALSLALLRAIGVS